MKKHFNTSVGRGLNFGLITVVLISCASTFFSFGVSFANGSDDFNDSLRQFWKWRWGFAANSGRLKETGGHLEYATKGEATSYDQALRWWTATRFPYNNDWDIQLDLHNSVTLTDNDQVTSFGLEIYCLKRPGKSVYAELYSSHMGNPPQRSGFYAEASAEVATDTGKLPVVDGAVRIFFDSTEKIITVYYDNDTADGYQWVEFGSFGIAGAGGLTGAVDWGLTEKDRLGLMVYGYSSNTAVAAGEMFADNFKETGGSGLCPIAKTLGEHDPATVRLRAFRDSMLANSAIGRKIVSIYYNNADSINAALESSPTFRAITSRVLEALAQRVGEN